MLNRNVFGVGMTGTPPGAATFPAAHAAARAAAHKRALAAATDASVDRCST
jgi:hypothetical protein